MWVVTEIERSVGCVGSAFALKRSLSLTKYNSLALNATEIRPVYLFVKMWTVNTELTKPMRADLNVIVCQSSDLQLLIPQAYRYFQLTSSGTPS